MHRSIPVVATTATASIAISFVAAIAGPLATTAAHAATAAKTTTTAAKKTTVKTLKFVGPSADMQWGPVQVTIFVKNRKIINITATAPTERPRSQYINSIAVPMLVQEVLKAQSAKIYAISGATMTSDAFYTSLLPALKAAKL